jgi:hypothetical protein
MEKIAKVLAVSLILVLIIILSNLFGHSVATHSPTFFSAIGYILQVIWHALQDILQVGDHINN